MRSFISILATGLAILTGALAVDCQGKAFTDADVDACVAELCNWDAGRGPGGYPHHFGNRETLSLGQYTTDPDLYEYPMLDNGRVYKGGMYMLLDPRRSAPRRNDT